VREFGPEGVKKGMATTLPVALGKLQEEGQIRRISMNGRLDQQRYRYTRWLPNPLAQFKLSSEEAQTELARRYFTWIGPATLSEFQWFSALGVKAAKAAIAPLGLVSLDEGDERMIFPADRDALRAFKIPKKPAYALVATIDGLTLLRRAIAELLDEKDLERKMFTEKGLVAGSGLADLPSHGIFDRGRLIGLWSMTCPANRWRGRHSPHPTPRSRKRWHARRISCVRNSAMHARSVWTPKEPCPSGGSLAQSGRPLA